jgi:hypothetical protein
LNNKNPYHVLLSYKIQQKKLSVKGETGLNLIEIQKILENGNFENNIDEEEFLLADYEQFEPAQVVNIVEANLSKIINHFHQNKNLDDRHFRFMLSTYLEMVRKNNIDETERRTLLEREIKSPKLIIILDELWEKPNKETEQV